jgi:dynactin 1
MGSLADSPVVDMEPPWLARVGIIKQAAAYNADTERKVGRMSEELKEMVREVKLRVSLIVGEG